jgi:hypothetical protein
VKLTRTGIYYLIMSGKNYPIQNKEVVRNINYFLAIIKGKKKPAPKKGAG